MCAAGGPQSIPGVTLQEAYRFGAVVEGVYVEGFTYKALPRRILWEARVDSCAVVCRGETRREAIEAALREVASKAPPTAQPGTATV